MRFIYTITRFNNPNDLLDLNKLKKAKKYNVKAKCVGKYIGADQLAYCTFEMEDGSRVATPVNSSLYGEILIGDEGELYYGTLKGMNIFGSWKRA